MVRNLYTYVVIVWVCMIAPLSVRAAVLSISQSDNQVEVGSTVVATIFVDSEGVAINNAEGILVVPSNFEVVSVNQSPSIFTLWIQQPSPAGNTISFNGGLPSPGYTGQSGRIFSTTLRAKEAGSGSFTFSGAAVRANDGLGTDVLRTSGSATVTVVQPPPAPVQAESPSYTPVEVASAAAIKVRSSTHPSQEAWYAHSEPLMELILPPGTDAVQTLLSERPGTTPIVTYRPAIREKQLDTLEDGVWYFNVRPQTAQGWGEITTYKLQIDTQAPSLSDFSITYQNRQFDINGSATDSLSGVARIELLVDGMYVTDLDATALKGGAHSSVPFNVHVPFSTSVSLSVGIHAAAVRISDAAGNTYVTEPVDFIAEAPESPLAGIKSIIFSFDPSIFTPWALPVSILSLMMNVWLWLRLRNQERRPVRGSGVKGDKFQRAARQRLTIAKKDLQKQLKELERANKRLDITPADASHIKKVRAHLEETQQYIEQKIKDVEKP
ncbi:hypothetical protein IT396_00045 [Candidatus Nomurabacteria bacterium]|nr:hypothetical protein [Candidatus Nomurabacteria bacterium]